MMIKTVRENCMEMLAFIGPARLGAANSGTRIERRSVTQRQLSLGNL